MVYAVIYACVFRDQRGGASLITYLIFPCVYGREST